MIKKKGESCEIIAKDIKISKRRVEHIWKEYHKTGEEPLVGKNLGRPKKAVIPEEVEILKKLLTASSSGQECLNPSLKDSIIFTYLIIEFTCTCFQKVW